MTLSSAYPHLPNPGDEVFILLFSPNAQSWEMATYPHRPELAFFRDQSLYFFLLPRDILEYCVRPLLDHPFPRVPCGENWISPFLVKSIPLPYITYYHMIVLKNGNLLLINLQETEMQMIDFLTTELQWKANNFRMVKFKYTGPTDSLMVQLINDSMEISSHHIQNFSQVRTGEEFHAQLVAIPSSSGSVHLASSVYGNTPKDLTKLARLIDRLPIDPRSIMNRIYCGGYIILVRRNLHPMVKEYVEFYQCLR